MLDKRGPRSPTTTTYNVVLSDDEISIIDEPATSKAKPASAARGRGRGAARGRGTARGAKTVATKTSLNLSITSGTKSLNGSGQPKIADSFKRGKREIVYEIDSDSDSD